MLTQKEVIAFFAFSNLEIFTKSLPFS